jgi:hypothetical protein
MVWGGFLWKYLIFWSRCSRFLDLACQGLGTTVIRSLILLVGRVGFLQDLGEKKSERDLVDCLLPYQVLCSCDLMA